MREQVTPKRGLPGLVEARFLALKEQRDQVEEAVAAASALPVNDADKRVALAEKIQVMEVQVDGIPGREGQPSALAADLHDTAKQPRCLLGVAKQWFVQAVPICAKKQRGDEEVTPQVGVIAHIALKVVQTEQCRDVGAAQPSDRLARQHLLHDKPHVSGQPEQQVRRCWIATLAEAFYLADHGRQPRRTFRAVRGLRPPLEHHPASRTVCDDNSLAGLPRGQTAHAHEITTVSRFTAANAWAVVITRTLRRTVPHEFDGGVLAVAQPGLIRRDCPSRCKPFCRIGNPPRRVNAHDKEPEDSTRQNAVMQTSLIAPVQEAQVLIGRWRDQLDPWARQGIPAHVTVAAPFLPLSRITEAVIQHLEAAAGARERPVIVFDRVAHLPGAVSLLPADEGALTALTSDLIGAWPDVGARLRSGAGRPYHLTVACTDDPWLFGQIATGLRSLLPIRVELTVVTVVAHDAKEVRTVAQLALGVAS